MPRPRSAMRKIREILRLSLGEGLSRRRVGAAPGLPYTTVADHLRRARRPASAGRCPDGMDDARARGPPVRAGGAAAGGEPAAARLAERAPRAAPHGRDPAAALAGVQGAPARRATSTASSASTTGAGSATSTWSCARSTGPARSSSWTSPARPSRSSTPRPARSRPAQLFVAVLGASNYTYAEALPCQELPDWIAAHVHAFEYFGGCPALIVSRQPERRRHPRLPLRARHQPDLPGAGRPLRRRRHPRPAPASHGTRPRSRPACWSPSAGSWPPCATDVLLPRRGQRGHPRAAGVAQRAPVPEARRVARRASSRSSTGRRCGRCRRSPTSSPTGRGPRSTSTTTSRSTATTTACPTSSSASGSTCASRPGRSRSSHRAGAWPAICARCARRRYTTDARAHARRRTAGSWSGPRRASSAGPRERARHRPRWCAAILARRPHPEQGYRACLGILRLGRRYGAERLEAAAPGRLADPRLSATAASSRSSRPASTASRCPSPSPATSSGDHANVRGAAYYD